MTDCNETPVEELAGKIADVLEERGWTHGSMVDQRTGAVCLLGAAGIVCEGRPDAGWALLEEVTYTDTLTGNMPTEGPLARQAMMRLGKKLASATNRSVVWFNSTHGFYRFNDTAVNAHEIIEPLRKIQRGEIA